MLNENITKITPDELMNVFGFSPADNAENFTTALPWKSKLIGQQIRSLFDYKRALDSVSKEMWIFGPFGDCCVLAKRDAGFDADGQSKPAHAWPLERPGILMPLPI